MQRAIQLIHRGSGPSRSSNGISSSEILNQDRAIFLHIKKAIDLYHHVIFTKWDIRFAQIEIPTLMDLNRVMSLMDYFGLTTFFPMDRLLRCQCDVDLRIVLQWDTDKTDVELHVVEPDGEKCYCMHNKTKNGGILSKDFSYGYGPEEYVIRFALSGEYKIYAKLFSENPSTKTFTNIITSIYTNFGRPQLEKKRNVFVTLKEEKQVQLLATVIC